MPKKPSNTDVDSTNSYDEEDGFIIVNSTEVASDKALDTTSRLLKSLSSESLSSTLLEEIDELEPVASKKKPANNPVSTTFSPCAFRNRFLYGSFGKPTVFLFQPGLMSVASAQINEISGKSKEMKTCPSKPSS